MYFHTCMLALDTFLVHHQFKIGLLGIFKGCVENVLELTD